MDSNIKFNELHKQILEQKTFFKSIDTNILIEDNFELLLTKKRFCIEKCISFRENYSKLSIEENECIKNCVKFVT